MADVNVFDQIRGISAKNYLFSEKDYTGYVANIYFSFFPDTIFFANEINKYHLEAKRNHDFYYYSLSKGKRYSKWIKAEKSNELDIISEAYHVSRKKAKEILRLLDDDDMETIRKELDKGGQE